MMLNSTILLLVSIFAIGIDCHCSPVSYLRCLNVDNGITFDEVFSFCPPDAADVFIYRLYRYSLDCESYQRIGDAVLVQWQMALVPILDENGNIVEMAPHCWFLPGRDMPLGCAYCDYEYVVTAVDMFGQESAESNGLYYVYPEVMEF